MTSGIVPPSLGDVEARNSNGSGNNLANPTWGMANTYTRLTNTYADGLGEMDTGPAPRLISDTILAQPKIGGVEVDLPNAAETNEFFQFFGQFLTHDITEGAAGDRSESTRLDGLPFPFVRTGSTIDGNGVRQQFTVETSFLDLSTVYGENDAMLNFLRADLPGGGQSAKLLTSAANVLPSFQDVATDAGVTPQDVLAVNGGTTALGVFAPTLLVSGDDRTNQSAALITQHTIWLREHNYQVDRLSAQFPSWTPEQLFQAARAITEAEWQKVVYGEYLPKLIGATAIEAYSGYKANVNPAVINEWANIAFRFGHDQSSNSFDILAENGGNAGTFTLGDAFLLANASNAIRDGGSLDQWVRGQLSHQTQEIDGKIVDGNRNLLFGGATTDLNVLDIQRGRDHGVGDYNTVRGALSLGSYGDFAEFAADNNLDAATLAALIDVYGTIDQLDALVGGLLEKKAAGSQLGEMFTRLTVMQFQNLRDGDRFYYENRFADEPGLLAAIKGTSFAQILARNTDIQYLYHDAFAAHDRIGGTALSESLFGSAKKDLILGFDGDDLLSGSGGDDDLYGGTGNDILIGGAGTDRLDGESGNDTASYSGSAAVTVNLETGTASGGDAEGDTLISIENLTGGGGADVLTGNGSANRLDGGGGNDVLIGGGGDDTLIGGAGADQLDGGSGNDTASYAGSTAVSVDLETGNGSGGDAAGDTLVSIENLIGSAQADWLRGNGGANRLEGGEGNDTLIGGAGDDVLEGGDGDDNLDGGTGADLMRGGAGNDFYMVDNALDTVWDSGGYDVIHATVDFALAAGAGIEVTVATGARAFTLSGNDSDNRLIGGSFGDRLYGGDGSDTLEGAGGDDGLYGGTGHDRLVGSSGRDRLYGDSGNDKLLGGSGSDYLRGGSGNDWLSGGSSRDVMRGDSGRDTFVFDTRPNKKSNLDTIQDFNVRDDRFAFDNSVFKKLGKGSETKPGKLNKNYFTIGEEAQDRNDYLVYNKKNGILSYDSDGSGKAKAVEVAVLKKNLKLNYHDFLII